MAKFKVGDRVRIIDKNDRFFGMVGKITRKYSNRWDVIVYFNNGMSELYDFENLEHVSPSFDTLVVGDIIVDECGDEALILEVGVNTFLRSYWNDFEVATIWIKFEEAKNKGWAIKGQPTPKKQFTHQEICEKLGVDDFEIIK